MIVSAAIMKGQTIFTGRRHADIIASAMGGFFKNCKQGFVDENGKFYNRQEAAKHALACKQIDKLHYGTSGDLFSEDLY
jgi:hypothetical protein